MTECRWSNLRDGTTAQKLAHVAEILQSIEATAATDDEREMVHAISRETAERIEVLRAIEATKRGPAPAGWGQ